MGKWCFLPYDFDTGLGINNEGSLVFSYELEDIDQVSGADVFNGQHSVLWVNLRQAYRYRLYSHHLRCSALDPWSIDRYAALLSSMRGWRYLKNASSLKIASGQRAWCSSNLRSVSS